MRKITIFGTGYVGLVSGVCLAELGHGVLCVDINQEKIDRLSAGECPIFEVGLPELLARNQAEGRLEFTTDMDRAVEHGELQFIAVGTPSDESGAADLQYVMAVAQTVGERMKAPKIIVNKSTSPVGTADKIKTVVNACLAERDAEIDCAVVSNPEFLAQGAAVKDFMEPDRVIIGVDDVAAEHAMRDVYQAFHDRLLIMNVRSAELSKYAANAILASRISFMNEMSDLAEQLGADIKSVQQAMVTDPRIGQLFLNAGCGYGGSCFPKDVKALAQAAEALGLQAQLMNAIDQVNQRQKQILFRKLDAYFKQDLNGKVIAVLGLAFKPNTDDMREAPSIDLMQSLWEVGAKVQAFDPVARTVCEQLFPNDSKLTLVDSVDAALDNADALVLVTEWPEFNTLDFNQVKKALRYPVVIDGRNMFEPKKVTAAGLTYLTIGRGTYEPEDS